MEGREMAAVGIDTGEASVWVCVAESGIDPGRWAVHEVLLTDPRWHVRLLELVPEGAVVAIEPTGWYYSRPIVQVLLKGGRDVVYVRHDTTAAARQERVSSQKTDPNDARALAVKARDFEGGGYTRGVRRPNPEMEELVVRLRGVVAARRLHVRLHGAAMNRLRTYARGVWPSLSNHLECYLRAVGAGAVTLGELRALSLAQEEVSTRCSAYRHGMSRRALRLLVAELPDDAPEVPGAIAGALRRAFVSMVAEDAAVAELDLELVACIDVEPIAGITALWRTVPGAFDVAIGAIHAACRCEVASMTCDQMRAACGCHPSRQESGRVVEAREAKRGYRPAKSALHLWTLALLNPAVTPRNAVRDLYDRLKRANHRFAVHSARGKLVRILSGMALNGTVYHYGGEHEQGG